MTRSSVLRGLLALAMGASIGACRSAAPAAQPADHEIALEPRADGGYSLKGPYEFAGTLTYDAEGWTLDGLFRFPSAGYHVGAVDVTVLKSLPEQVTIAIQVFGPPKDAMTAQVITEVPVVKVISVSRGAKFAIRAVANIS